MKTPSANPMKQMAVVKHNGNQMTWFERIAAAEERGFFLVRDYLAACDWKRCIASELHVTKNGDGMPVDPQLAQLTSEFPSYVYGGRASSVYGPSCLKLAFETFIAIQQRVAELGMTLTERNTNQESSERSDMA